MKEKTAVLVFDAEKRTFKHTTISTLDDIYENLNCRCFDIATRKIGDTYYDIYCDDEGLLKENPIVSAINHNGEVMLVGNLLFAKHNKRGGTVGLKEKEMDEIIENTVKVVLYTGDKLDMVMCEY